MEMKFEKFCDLPVTPALARREIAPFRAPAPRAGLDHTSIRSMSHGQLTTPSYRIRSVSYARMTNQLLTRVNTKFVYTPG